MERQVSLLLAGLSSPARSLSIYSSHDCIVSPQQHTEMVLSSVRPAGWNCDSAQSFPAARRWHFSSGRYIPQVQKTPSKPRVLWRSKCGPSAAAGFGGIGGFWKGKGPGPMMAPSSQEVTQVKYMSDFCVYLLYVGTSEVT